MTVAAAMAESEEQELIPETEAPQDVEATAQAEEKPAADVGDEFAEGGVESAVEAAETEAQPTTEEEERPPEEQETLEQPTEEEMAETSEEPIFDAPEVPAEEPADVETPADGDIDEPAVIEPEPEPHEEDVETVS